MYVCVIIEERLSFTEPEKQCFHLCIVNLIIEIPSPASRELSSHWIPTTRSYIQTLGIITDTLVHEYVHVCMSVCIYVYIGGDFQCTHLCNV